MQTLISDREAIPQAPSEPAPHWLRWYVLRLLPLVLSLALATDGGPVARQLPERPAPPPGPLPIRLLVLGRPVQAQPGLTLAQALRRYQLVPPAGDLLAVDGSVLQPSAYPGRVLLDGRTAPPATLLQGGDRITVVPGADRTEPLVRQVVPVRENEPGNPQFSLAIGPGEAIVTSGKLSHKPFSTVFRPTGPAKVPNAVALTFDDGPWPGTTQAILSILAAAHVHATFFLIGRQAMAHPELVRAEVAAGMVVENHSWSHPQPFAKLPERRIRDEIEMGYDALARLGVTPKLFRPPGGSLSPMVVGAAERLGMRTTNWSVDPTDWRPGTTAQQIVARVLGTVRAGSIILMHDGGGNRSATVAALPQIIAGLRARHLQMVLLS